MNETQFASWAAYGAAALFAVSLARFFFLPRLGLPAASLVAAELKAIVKQIGYWKIDHSILTGMPTFGQRQYPMPARLLDMSPIISYCQPV